MEETPGESRLEQARRCDDPYAAASFVLGVSGARQGSRRLVLKRKVLRHRPDGGVEVSDESVSSEAESDAKLWNLGQKMRQLRTDPADNSISEGEMETSSDESPSHCPTGDSPCFSLGDFGSRNSPVSQCACSVRSEPKSFIPPRLEPLGHSRGKTDRVAKYLEYKREWEKFPIPGEDQRQELRWVIREQMLCKPQLPPRPQHLSVPNAYVVPTDKKRAALRWEVRWDLAQGLIPRKNTSRSTPDCF